MILLWGVPGDGPLAAVRDALHNLGVRVAFLDQRATPTISVDMSVDSKITGIVQTADQVIDLGEVSAAYIRPYAPLHISNLEQAEQGSDAWRHAVAVDDALLLWAEIAPALIVNRPANMASNNSKPFQAALIRGCGFEVPETLITTDSRAAMEFWERHGDVIYKSISGIRSIVSRLTPQHIRRLHNVSWCPTQFQQYIAGIDYRVHVVGEEVFACEVRSLADDYRYAGRQGEEVEIVECVLCGDVADRCRELTASMGLLVAGVDLRRTPEGKWYCFEANPSPGFTYYQQSTGQPIAEAIARLLAEGA